LKNRLPFQPNSYLENGMLSPRKLAQLRGEIRTLSERSDEPGRIALAIMVLQGTLEIHASQIAELRKDVDALGRKGRQSR
jgi:hypothetical protein